MPSKNRRRVERAVFVIVICFLITVILLKETPADPLDVSYEFTIPYDFTADLPQYDFSPPADAGKDPPFEELVSHANQSHNILANGEEIETRVGQYEMSLMISNKDCGELAEIVEARNMIRAGVAWGCLDAQFTVDYSKAIRQPGMIDGNINREAANSCDGHNFFDMGAIKNWIGKFRFHFNDMPIGGLDAYSIGYSSDGKNWKRHGECACGKNCGGSSSDEVGPWGVLTPAPGHWDIASPDEPFRYFDLATACEKTSIREVQFIFSDLIKVSHWQNTKHHYLAETCMYSILQDDRCNHEYFGHVEKNSHLGNCRCFPVGENCSNRKSLTFKGGLKLYKILRREVLELKNAFTNVPLNGGSQINFRRYRPGEISNLSLFMYKHPWTPYSIQRDERPYCQISHKYKVVYMKCPKAGSSLLSFFMWETLGSEFGNCRYELSDPTRRIYQAATLDNKQGPIVYLDDYLFFVSVREPLTRFVSGYKESVRRGPGGILPLEGANFTQYENITHFINGVYQEDYSKVYDIHLHEQTAMHLLARHRIDHVIRLEHAREDWIAFQDAYPTWNIPNLNETYLSQTINAKNLARNAFRELQTEDIRKACWVLRREYCALAYPLPSECSDLFNCVELQVGDHVVYVPEPDIESKMGQMLDVLTYPQDLLQIHLNEQRKNHG